MAAGTQQDRFAYRAANEYLRTAQVARMLHVSPKTIARWASERRLPHVVTPGRHRRFPAKAIRALADSIDEQAGVGRAHESP